jgi:hypothetical protein
MAEISGLKTLKQVVQELIFSSGRSEADYFKFLQFAIRGFKEAKMLHMNGFTKIAKLTVTDINTIALPDDYMSFIRVVIPINGEYWSLTEKETLVYSQTGSVLDTDDGEGEEINDSYAITYGDVGGKNTHGYIKLDEVNDRIIVNKLDADRTEVMLIYVSTGINEKGTDTYVPDRIVRMLHMYILYSDHLYKNQPYEHYLKEYEREVDKVKFLEAPSFDAFRDALYEVFTSTPQR